MKQLKGILYNYSFWTLLRYSIYLCYFFCTFRIENSDADRSFESNVRNFLAEENSPNCFGKVKEFPIESSLEIGENDSTNTSETYTIESDFETWNKVSK